MRLGIYGGSFDPVHYGHLLLAECCREELRLDAVWLVPAAAPPHKQGRAVTPAKARVEMLQLALGGHEAITVSTIEIDRGGVSYTVETLRTINAMHPGAELFLLMGADMLLDLPTWREPAEICRLAIPATVRRPGFPPLDFSPLAPLVTPERLDEIRRHQVEMPQMGLSGTEIRQRVGQGKSIRYRTPRAVEKYIEANGLYR